MTIAPLAFAILGSARADRWGLPRSYYLKDLEYGVGGGGLFHIQ